MKNDCGLKNYKEGDLDRVVIHMYADNLFLAVNTCFPVVQARNAMIKGIPVTLLAS